MGFFDFPEQLDRIESAIRAVQAQNTLTAKRLEQFMSQTDEALARLAQAVVSAVTKLQEAQAAAKAAKETSDAVVANDAAEDAAQMAAVDTSTSGAIDAVTADLIAALQDPEVPADPPTEPEVPSETPPAA